MQTEIDLLFGDGTYTFRLPLPQIDELQRKTGVGIGALFSRIIKGRYALPGEDGGLVAFGDPSAAEFAVADVLEPIRLGLIGGGKGRVGGDGTPENPGTPVVVDPVLAQALMASYCYPARPLSEAWTLSTAILTACIEGWTDPDKKKEEEATGEAATETTTPADGSTIREPSGISPLPDAAPSPPAP